MCVNNNHVIITLMNQLNRLNTSFQPVVLSLRKKTCSLAYYRHHSTGIRFSRFTMVSLVKYMQQSEGNVSDFLLSRCLQVRNAIISQNFITALLKAYLRILKCSCYLSRQSLFHL